MSTLRDLLMDLHREHGTITPTLVVEAATPTDSPLHKYFDWNDSTAAHKWRIEQAREHIRTARIQYVHNGTKKTTRAFISVRHGETGPSNYQPTEEVVTDEMAKRIALRDFERRLRDLRTEFGHFKEYAALMEKYAKGGDAA